MSVVALSSASYCHGDDVAKGIAERLSYRLYWHEELTAEAARRAGVPAPRVERALWGPPSVFNRFTHERERNIAWLRMVLAERVAEDGLVYNGPAARLLPRELTHVLRVGLVAGPGYRTQVAAREAGVDEKAARRLLRKSDADWQNWTLYLHDSAPWDESLFDILLPRDQTTIEEGVQLVCDHAGNAAVRTTPRARQAMDDFLLACRVYLALAEHGSDLEVRAQGSKVTLVVNRFVVWLEQYQAKLRNVAAAVPGVEEVETTVGPRFRQPDNGRELEPPPKILLVDDEREFVLTLSERLESRNLGSAVAYDGEEALAIIKTDPCDVMVLDLKMPGIDGLEVLKRVKKERPGTQVIILTGHGSEREQERARALGAFAYLNKPVDIDVLARAMREAYQKARQSAPSAESPEDGNE